MKTGQSWGFPVNEGRLFLSDFLAVICSLVSTAGMLHDTMAFDAGGDNDELALVDGTVEHIGQNVE